MAQTKVVSEKTKWEAGIFTLSPEFPPYPAVTRNRILSLLERLSELLLERQDRHHSAVMRASPRSAVQAMYSSGVPSSRCGNSELLHIPQGVESETSALVTLPSCSRVTWLLPTSGGQVESTPPPDQAGMSKGLVGNPNPHLGQASRQ